MINGPRYEGKPCSRCGSTTRYISNNKCIACVTKWAQIYIHNQPERTRHRGKACAICGDPMVSPCYDHAVGTERFRGWLCHRCNRALGVFNDSIELLRRAADYLEKHAFVGGQYLR